MENTKVPSNENFENDSKKELNPEELENVSGGANAPWKRPGPFDPVPRPDPTNPRPGDSIPFIKPDPRTIRG